MIKLGKLKECVWFFAIAVVGFLGLQWITEVGSSQTVLLSNDSSSNVSDSIAQADTQCDALGVSNYFEHLERASDSDPIFAGCGGFM